MTKIFKFNSISDTYTFDLGAKLGKIFTDLKISRVFVAIYGDLGSGKTVFTRGFASVLSSGSRVKSPTYTIVNEYLRGDVPLYHFDFYRIENVDELDGIGFDDYLNGGICIAEWCEKLGDDIPQGAVLVNFKKTNDTEREITVEFPDSEVYNNVDLGL